MANDSPFGAKALFGGMILSIMSILKAKAIIRLNPDTEAETVWEFPERIGCIAPCNNGQLLYAGDNGISIFDPQTNKSSPITDPESHLPDNRFNDGKCDPYGRFWGGTISLKKIQGSAALYCLDSQQNIEKKLEGLTNSNGLAWSQDKKRFFHIDTPRRSIQAYAYNNDTSKFPMRQQSLIQKHWGLIVHLMA